MLPPDGFLKRAGQAALGFSVGGTTPIVRVPVLPIFSLSTNDIVPSALPAAAVAKDICPLYCWIILVSSEFMYVQALPESV